MNCFECGGTFEEKNGLLKLTDKYVGLIIIEGVLYYQCENCGALLYPEETIRAIEIEGNRCIEETLKSYPIKDYLSAAETALLLGISRQALHKNNRIRHGFIYQIKFGGNTVYLKQSVLQYQATGDGRFGLSHNKQTTSKKYIESTIYGHSKFVNINPSFVRVYKKSSIMGNCMIKKEKTYVN
jgi:hypothetical protein